MPEHDKRKDTGVEDTSTGDTGKFGTLAEVMALIESGTDVNAPDADGRTPLGLAAEHGDPRCINALIEAGAQVDSHDGHMSVLHGPDVSAEEKKAKAQSGVYNGAPTSAPLHRAARRRSPANVNALIEAGADIHARENCEPERTALHIAAESGSPVTVSALLDAGADTGAKNYNGSTALHMAAESGSPETIKVLLNAGADIRAQCDWFGRTPLHKAVENGDNFENVTILLDAGARVDAKCTSGATPLHAAAKALHSEVANILLNAGANADARDRKGRNALQFAVVGDLEHFIAVLSLKGSIRLRWRDREKATMVRTLAAATAIIDEADDSGQTALHLAAISGVLDLVNTPMFPDRPFDTDEDRDAMCGDGAHTLGLGLICASRKGMPATIGALMEAGASSSVRDRRGWTPLHYSAHFGIAANVQALTDSGATSNVLTRDRETPLHLAAGSSVVKPSAPYDTDLQGFADALEPGVESCIRMLVQAGCDPNAKDKHGRTAVSIAIEAGFSSRASILRAVSVNDDTRDFLSLGRTASEPVAANENADGKA